jgi:hypothetical protein
MPSDIQPNGLLSQLVGIKAQKQAQDKLNAIQTYKSILDPDNSATEGMRQYAGNSMLALIGQEFGGGGKGGKAGAGNPIVDLFKHVIGKAVSAGGKSTAGNTPGAPAPDQRFLTRDQMTDQSQARADKAAEANAATAAKIDAAKEQQRLLVKRQENQQTYETEFKRLTESGMDPARAAEEANAFAAGRAAPTVKEPTERDIVFQAYADAHGKDVKTLTAKDKIDAIREGRNEEKPPAAPTALKQPTAAQIQFQAYADKHGKKVEDLTADDKIKAVKEAREEERLPARTATGGAGAAGGTAQQIKEGTPDFKIAQDLAYGKLTFPEFRGLFAYSRDAAKREAIYSKASELNPQFNAAGFERGYKFSSNVSVQKQLASLDNVKSGVGDLLKLSEAASRTGVPLLNEAIIKGGVLLGGKRYSNFQTARTAFADELSGALGYGSATDMSRRMGFDMTNPALSPEAFRQAIQDIVIPFINRKKDSLLEQMGPYGTSAAGGSGSTGGSPATKSAAPKTADELLKSLGR